MPDPEATYAAACRHWRACATCSEAGAEWAEPSELCPEGRALGEAWDAAERAAAKFVPVSGASDR